MTFKTYPKRNPPIPPLGFDCCTANYGQPFTPDTLFFHPGGTERIPFRGWYCAECISEDGGEPETRPTLRQVQCCPRCRGTWPTFAVICPDCQLERGSGYERSYRKTEDLRRDGPWPPEDAPTYG